MKVLIAFCSRALLRWLTKILRVSSPLKLRKTSCFQQLPDEAIDKHNCSNRKKKKKKTGKIKDVLLLGWTAGQATMLTFGNVKKRFLGSGQTIRVQLKAQNVPDDDHHIYIVFLTSDI